MTQTLFYYRWEILGLMLFALWVLTLPLGGLLPGHAPGPGVFP